MEKVSMNKLEMARRVAKGGNGGTIPPATSETLGGVKIGEGINITEDGTISPAIISMASNTDYLTNKVLNNKSVYMRYIDLEEAVGNRDILSNVDNILSINLRIVDTTREMVLPNYNLDYKNSFSWRLNMTTHKIEYQTSDSNSTYAIRGYIEYTKTGA